MKNINYIKDWRMILATIIVGIIVFLVIRKIIIKLKPTSESQSVKLFGKEINQDELTYSDAQYMAWANALYVAMDGWGTDEDAIYAILGQLRTKSDWFRLVKDFGVKEKQDLISWLNSELDSSERAIVNSILKKFESSI